MNLRYGFASFVLSYALPYAYSCPEMDHVRGNLGVLLYASGSSRLG